MRRLPIVCFLVCAVLLLTNCNKHDSDSTPPVATKPTPVDFTVTANGISVNPNGYTPLSAQLTFYSVKSGRTFIRVHGRHGALTDVTHLFSDTGAFHSIPVIGMYADTANTVDIRIVDNAGDTVAQSTAAIVTQALPSSMPSSVVASVPDASQVVPGMYLVSNYSTSGTAGKPCIPYMMDAYGDTRWVLDYSSNTELSNMNYEDGIARLKNGNFYFGNSVNGTIYEIDILGNVINRWTIPGYLFHHEVHEEANGNFLLNATKIGSTYTNNSNPTIEDYVIEIDRNSKQIIDVWDLKQSLNENRIVWGAPSNGDWFHGNALLDDSTDNTIIVSGREQGVVKLDRSNNVKWILAPHKDWGVNGRGDSLYKYLLTPLDASGDVIADTTVAYGSTIAPDFEWNCYEHSPIQLPNGDLMMFDNGTNRTLDAADGSNPRNGAPGKYSRAVEFKIDPVKMTVQQIWQYGKERDVDAYSSIVSSVQFLPESKHVIFAPGYNVKNEAGYGGKIIEVNYDTRAVVNEIEISATNTFSHHRAKKINAYPDNL